MFYSQTFLGRKGPLGTVWCAAHLQHRLKKSHYASTNIPKTVDYIMYSEVPIALRMSGHLLLGVVRIYSKQVDFLFQDCNFILSGLRKAFTSFKLDLPKNAMQAPVQSITLPTTFELDALDVDETYDDWDRDSHCRSLEDITLLDQVPTGQDLYVAISFDEDMFESSPSVLVQGRDSNKRNEEAHFRDATKSLLVETANETFKISGTSTPNTAGVGGFDGLNMQELPENAVRHDLVPEIEGTHNSVPEIEVMRDADSEIEVMRDANSEIEVMRDEVIDSVLDNFSPTVDGGKDSERNQVPSENEAMTTSMKHTSALSLGVTPPQQHSDLPTFTDVQEAAQSFCPDAAFELASPDLVIRPSPPMPQPQARKRKRKQFDECVVLKNSFIKKALDDRRDILRERKGIPSSTLGLWKLNKCSRKERIFEEPITTGLGRDIHPAFETNFTSVRAKFLPSPEVPPEIIVPQTSEPTVAAFPGDGASDYAHNCDTEIEQPRHGDGQIDRNEHWESFNFPSMADNSSLRREELCPTSASARSESEMPYQRSLTESVMPPMPDPLASTELYRSWAQSPQTFLEEDLDVNNTCLPDIPEPSFTEGLDFLEADNDSPGGTSEAGKAGLLSMRTRAVAQFLKGCSPVSSRPEEARDLSLDRILEGRRRKVCARMFFETLVLKNYGLIDVHQGKPYTDIKLKLTPTLSKNHRRRLDNFSGAFLLLLQPPKKSGERGLVDAIGNTPLIRINSLSDATGCEHILGKCEFLNPGGSVKDRVAVKIIEEALESGKLARGGVVTEGSAGSTAISLATVAPAYGCRYHVAIPDNAAIEKSHILEALGATVERVRPVSISHRDHFVNIARRRAVEADEIARKFQNPDQEDGVIIEQINGHHPHKRQLDSTTLGNYNGGFFADQFENLANFRSHYEGTGPEIWEQTGGSVEAFVAAAGTGGTVAGVSRYLQKRNPKVKCFLIDPPGSGLYNKVTRGVMYTKEEAEGRRLKNPFDTITEGIGVNRLTENFMMANLDGAFRGTDKEAVEMSRFLMRSDGLFLGSSSAMNCVGAVKVARLIGPGHTIVTILCNSEMRHLSKFYNDQYLCQYGLMPEVTGLEFLGIK